MGPDLKPLKAVMNYIVRLLEAIADAVKADRSQLNPPPPLT